MTLTPKTQQLMREIAKIVLNGKIGRIQQTFGETTGFDRGASATLLLDWDGLMLMLSFLGTSTFKSEPTTGSGSRVSGNGTTSGRMFRSVLIGCTKKVNKKVKAETNFRDREKSLL